MVALLASRLQGPEHEPGASLFMWVQEMSFVSLDLCDNHCPHCIAPTRSSPCTLDAAAPTLADRVFFMEVNAQRGTLKNKKLSLHGCTLYLLPVHLCFFGFVGRSSTFRVVSPSVLGTNCSFSVGDVSLCTGAHLGPLSRSSVSHTHPQFSRLGICSDKAAVKLGAPLP